MNDTTTTTIPAAMQLDGRQREFVERARELAAVETAEDLRAYYAADPMGTGTETEAAAFGSARFLLEKLVEIIDGQQALRQSARSTPDRGESGSVITTPVR
jgi:hypothetical protein